MFRRLAGSYSGEFANKLRSAFEIQEFDDCNRSSIMSFAYYPTSCIIPFNFNAHI